MTAPPAIHVTRHAIDRYRERIGANSDEEALAVLSGPAVRAAAAFGAWIVRLPRGRIVLGPKGDDAFTVVTVVPMGRLPWQLFPASWGNPGPRSGEG